MNENAILVLTGLGLAVLLGFWQLLWRPYAVDSFRQDLYAVRDRLFDIAMRHPKEFGFNSEGYQNLRAQLHSMIRFAHQATFLSACLLRIFRRLGYLEARKQVGPFEAETARLEPAVAKLVRGEIRAWRRSTLIFLFKACPGFLTLIGWIILSGVCSAIWQLLKKGPRLLWTQYKAMRMAKLESQLEEIRVAMVAEAELSQDEIPCHRARKVALV